jgi:hypothetical protein
MNRKKKEWPKNDENKGMASIRSGESQRKKKKKKRFLSENVNNERTLLRQ